MASPNRAHISVSRATYDKLDKLSQQTGAPISVLVELAVSESIGAPLSKQAQEWATKLSARKAG